ncbi:histone-lysine N-methyltransferase CLF [Striga asiatica]|uniref:Histone-lysine N-methyltransferase CLF n=1 Tax=Striga asiatica TaxID=4170 RepID=A0A5A7PDZ6_STRAF|nr:histone-lysine N-methyltransferase CLF [Striga asiatica]
MAGWPVLGSSRDTSSSQPRNRRRYHSWRVKVPKIEPRESTELEDGKIDENKTAAKKKITEREQMLKSALSRPLTVFKFIPPNQNHGSSLHESDLQSELHCRIERLSASSAPPPAMSPPKASPSASGSELPSTGQIAGVQETSSSAEEVLAVIDSLKKQVASNRSDRIKKRLQENTEKVVDVMKNLYKLSMERRNTKLNCGYGGVDLLAKRQKDAIDMHNGIGTSNGDNESSSSQDDGYAPSAILLGSSIAVKNAVRPIKLPEVKKLPPYTTWIFLDRNQRMTEDQSVVGRRRIYYDQNGGEALICSDSEEEAVEDEEEKKEFLESEDYILRSISSPKIIVQTTIKEVGFSDLTLDMLAQCLSRKPCEIKGRYDDLMKSNNALYRVNNANAESFVNPYIDKDLDAALDSFDNLFCRRCLWSVQAEKQSAWSCQNVEKEPCGPNCHHLVHGSDDKSSRSANFEEKSLLASNGNTVQVLKKKKGVSLVRKKSKSCQSGSVSSSDTKPVNDVTSPVNGAGKSGGDKRSSKRIAENVVVAKKKRQKKMATSDSDSVAADGLNMKNLNCQDNEDGISSLKMKSTSSLKSRRKVSEPLQGDAISGASDESDSGQPMSSSGNSLKKEEFIDENMCKQEIIDNRYWKPFEKALYEKGIQIFGRNSCLIARNLMSGLKTCSEIFKYMHRSDKKMSQDGDGMILPDGCLKADVNEIVASLLYFFFAVINGFAKGNGARRRSRFLRRKGRVRRLKYTWKSAGSQSFRKRISERKDQPCRQYSPCGCQSACGKTCPCLINGTCCEKYCGCPKSCKNRFRGCHCAKSQCRSRQCPCFAADRECDPDVCRNCWIGCGDGTLGVPFQRGDNYECRNMKLLLKQQQRVLLGRSDVSGWGAFLKFVLDAYRKGDKLKFANHSPVPNCYAKVIMVAGDHRVGIFAKERISAGEELFYDYRYEADRAPAWAKKPEASGAKKEDGAAPSGGRAKKHT